MAQPGAMRGLPLIVALASCPVGAAEGQGATLLGAAPFITLSTGGLRGSVCRGTGAPVAGVVVLLTARDGRTWAARTGGNGEFRAGLLPPGEYRLSMMKEGSSSRVIHGFRVRPNAWLIAGDPPQMNCGTPEGWIQLRNRGHSYYESSTGQCTSWTAEELERLPLH